MAVKRIEAESGCFAKAGDDEPLFVLRAQDATAPKYVRQWADDNRDTIGNDKYAEAYQLAEAMEAWPNRKQPD